MDFARLEILKLLAKDPTVRTRVFKDCENIAAIEAADLIITYTCDVMPSLKAQEALRAWLAKGGRWYALHGTNSVLRLLENGLWDAPRWAPLRMNVLGSQFISHPPIAPYTVTVADPTHRLVAGNESTTNTLSLGLLTLLRSPEAVAWLFADPEAFEPRRANARAHLAFGRGIHTCIGNLLARRELAVAFEMLLDRFETIELDGDPADIVFAPNVLLRGPSAVPIRYRMKS